MQCVCRNSDENQFKVYKYWQNEGQNPQNEKTDENLGYACKKCGQEWLKEEFLYEKCEERLIAGEDFIKQTPPYLTDQPWFQVHGYRAKIEKQDPLSLKIGDHVAWHRIIGYWHHAIVVKVDGENRSLKLIHWTSASPNKLHYGKDKAKVMEEDVEVDKQKGAFYRIDYPIDIEKKNPPELVLARAKSSLGERGYNIQSNNCETLATFCKTGVLHSCQVSWGLLRLKEAAVGFLVNILEPVYYMLKDGAKELGKFTGTIMTESLEDGAAEIIEVISCSASFNVVGAVVIVVIESGFAFYEIYKLYESRKKENITWEDFIASAGQRIWEALLTALLGIAGGAPWAKAITRFRSVIQSGLGLVFGKCLSFLSGSMVRGIFDYFLTGQCET